MKNIKFIYGLEHVTNPASYSYIQGGSFIETNMRLVIRNGT